jgi:hypothetical protein
MTSHLHAQAAAILHISALINIILTASNVELLHRTISALQKEFTMKDLGLLHHFLGVSV